MAEAKPPLFPKPNGKPVKPPKKWDTLGGLTFEQYKALPQNKRMEILNASAVGLVYELHTDPIYGKPYWKGVRLKP